MGDRRGRGRARPPPRGHALALLERHRPLRRGPRADRGRAGATRRRGGHRPPVPGRRRPPAASPTGRPTRRRLERWYQQQLDLATAVDDAAGIADALLQPGPRPVHRSGGRGGSSSSTSPRSARRFRELGDRSRGVAAPNGRKGILAMRNGRPAEAARRSCARPSVEFEPLGRPPVPRDVARRASAGRRSPWATSRRRPAWRSSGLLGVSRDARPRHDHDLAPHRRPRGDDGRTAEDAAELTGAFEALCERYGVRPPAALERFLEGQDPFAVTRAALPPDVYEAAYERGRRLTLDEAVGDGRRDRRGRRSGAAAAQ